MFNKSIKCIVEIVQLLYFVQWLFLMIICCENDDLFGVQVNFGSCHFYRDFLILIKKYEFAHYRVSWYGILVNIFSIILYGFITSRVKYVKWKLRIFTEIWISMEWPSKCITHTGPWMVGRVFPRASVWTGIHIGSLGPEGSKRRKCQVSLKILQEGNIKGNHVQNVLLFISSCTLNVLCL